LARDELARATLGERFLVINMKSFNLFRNLSQEAKKSFEELEFLTKIQSIIQKELDKIPAAPQEVSTQDLSKKPEEFPKTLELEKKELAAPKAIKLKPRAKTAKEIEEQQARILDLFWKTLNQNLDGDSIDLIQEILSDPLFESIPRERIVNLNLNPFDFVLTKFNSLQLQEEKTRATILLNLLWINGFNHEDESALDKTLEYPVELNSALGREKVLREKSIDLDAILKNAQRNNFRLVGAALRRDAFPQAISDEEKEKIIKLTEIAILQSCAGHDYLLSRLQTQPWFRGVEEEIFIQTLENSNDSIAQFLLERKKGNPEFFIDFFSTHENLLSKIYNFALSSTTDKLEEEIKKDASLNAKIVQEVTQSSEFHHARDLSKLVEMLLLESNQNAKALIFKASLQFQRLLSTKPSPEKHAAINQVRILLERALSYERNDDESIERAKLLLANVYNYLKDSEKAKEILIPISSSSGDACYQLSMMGFSKDDSLAFLKKAAELFHPKATGIIAVQLLEAESDIEAKSDIKEAIKMLKKAVELGDLDSIANLGTTYINNREIHGLTIEESCKKGFELFKESTLRGSCIGAFNLANCYKNGWGVSKNIEQSLETYKLFIKICAQDKAEDRIDREDGDENEYKSENEIEIENLVSMAEREIALLESKLNPKKLISGAQAQTVVDAREAGQSVND